jgi:hypothetical protein
MTHNSALCCAARHSAARLLASRRVLLRRASSQCNAALRRSRPRNAVFPLLTFSAARSRSSRRSAALPDASRRYSPRRNALFDLFLSRAPQLAAVPLSAPPCAASHLLSTHLISSRRLVIFYVLPALRSAPFRTASPLPATLHFFLPFIGALLRSSTRCSSTPLGSTHSFFVTFAHRSAAYHIAACHIAAHPSPALLIAVLLAATLLTSPLLNVCFLLAFCLPRRGPPLRYATLLHSSRRSSSLHDALLLGSAIRNASPNLELFSFGTLPQRSAPHPHALRPQRNASSLISAHSNARSLTYENR